MTYDNDIRNPTRMRSNNRMPMVHLICNFRKTHSITNKYRSSSSVYHTSIASRTRIVPKTLHEPADLRLAATTAERPGNTASAAAASSLRYFFHENRFIDDIVLNWIPHLLLVKKISPLINILMIPQRPSIQIHSQMFNLYHPLPLTSSS
jgi:hypothetical protein